jgi:hypothetical protein
LVDYAETKISKLEPSGEIAAMYVSSPIVIDLAVPGDTNVLDVVATTLLDDPTATNAASVPVLVTTTIVGEPGPVGIGAAAETGPADRVKVVASDGILFSPC